MADDTIKLGVQVAGTDEVSKLLLKINALKKEMADLKTGYEQGYFGREATEKISLLSKELDKLERAYNKVNKPPVPPDGGQGKSGFQNLGMSVLFVSQAIEDLQYGFSAIVNNIPMIAMSMGAGAGVAGAASLAAVAVNQLSKAFASSLDYSKNFRTEIEQTKDALKGMADGTNKSNVARQLKREEATIESGTASIEQVGQGVDSGELYHGGLIKKALEESKNDKLRDNMLNAATNEEIASDPRIAALLKQNLPHMIPSAGGMGAAPVMTKGGEYDKEISLLQETARKNAEDQLAKLMDAAYKGDQKAIDALLRKVEAAGGKDVAESYTRAFNEQGNQASLAQQEYEDNRISADEAENEKRAKKRQAERMGRGQSYVAGVMTQQGNRVQESDARTYLESIGVNEENINKMIERQDELLQDRADLLRHQLLTQGYIGDVVDRMVADAQKTQKEKDDEADDIRKNSQRQKDSERLQSVEQNKWAGWGFDKDILAQQIMGLAANREQGGMGLGEEGAREMAQDRLKRQLMLPAFVGGQGLNERDAGITSAKMMAEAMPTVSESLAELNKQFPQSVAEFNQGTRALMQEMQRLEREGLKMYLGTRRTN